MTTDTALRCALGVSDRTLSDYRSAGLTPKHMKHLRTHVVQCLACQARLDEFETMARALRAQPELDGHTQLWQNVRASIAITSMQTALRRNHRTRSHSAQLWTAFGSIAAVMALAVGFVAVFASHGGPPPTTKSTPTPITIHSGSLTWKQVTFRRGSPVRIRISPMSRLPIRLLRLPRVTAIPPTPARLTRNICRRRQSGQRMMRARTGRLSRRMICPLIRAAVESSLTPTMRKR